MAVALYSFNRPKFLFNCSHESSLLDIWGCWHFCLPSLLFFYSLADPSQFRCWMQVSKWNHSGWNNKVLSGHQSVAISSSWSSQCMFFLALLVLPFQAFCIDFGLSVQFMFPPFSNKKNLKAFLHPLCLIWRILRLTFVSLFSKYQGVVDGAVSVNCF
jgi:hypothetical protein